MSFEIGPLPLVQNAKRREACRYDFALFCDTYLSRTFPARPTMPQAIAMQDLQELIFLDKPFADELERGGGKTSLTVAAILWCGFYGHRPYLAAILANEIAAQALMGAIKAQIEFNPLLGEDFPEVCYPIRILQGDARRANGQTVAGQLTRIVWRRHSIGFPCVAGADSRGFQVVAAALNGSLMGIVATNDEGERVRPSLLLIDDPVSADVLASKTALILRIRRTRDLIGAYPAFGMLVENHAYGHAFTKPEPAKT